MQALGRCAVNYCKYSKTYSASNFMTSLLRQLYRPFTLQARGFHHTPRQLAGHNKVRDSDYFASRRLTGHILVVKNQAEEGRQRYSEGCAVQ